MSSNLCAGGCNDGREKTHGSGEEAAYCDTLKRQLGREVQRYRSQVRYDLKDRVGKRVGFMQVDFEVIRICGTLQIHEYKGKLFARSQIFLQKKALFTWCYPSIEYIVVGKREIVL